MDAFARGLKIAHAIREDGRLAKFVDERYSSFDRDIGASGSRHRQFSGT